MLSQKLAVRSSEGVRLQLIDNSYNVQTLLLKEPPNQHAFSRTMKFSSDGSLFAFADGCSVFIVDVVLSKVMHTLDIPKCSALMFSPKCSFLCTWQPYSTSGAQSSPSNTFVFDTKSGNEASSFIQKQQQDWEPQWTDDEKLWATLIGSELQFHEDNNMERYANKLVIPKLTTFSLSSGPPPYHVAIYVAGSKGSPSFVRIYLYGNNIANSTPIANKSFFVADRVQMTWNAKGTALVVLASSDVDKSGASYYGEQHMYLMLTNGESFKLSLDKPGPIYHYQWNPSSQEFCVVYGFMPAKATLFNMKGESIFDFGPGSRNEAHYNPFGNIIALCGYGNLRGGMEFWSVTEKKLIHKIVAEDTTYFEWAKDGEHFITATTAPRLRVNNGFKIWDYSGAIRYQFLIPAASKNQQELWEVAWCPPSQNELASLKPPSIKWRAVADQKRTQSAQSSATAAYVPPHMRSKAGAPTTNGANEKSKNNTTTTKPASKRTEFSSDVQLTGDPEKDKKIRALKKKLDQIVELKQLQNEGKTLEVNQLDKIAKENQFKMEYSELTN